jgi:hypothetical protein
VRAFAFGLVLLGVCVFAWGLRYKLSLYSPPHSIARCMPAAKLLTGKERPAIPAVDLQRSANDGHLAMVALVGLALVALTRAQLAASRSSQLLAPAAGRLLTACMVRGPAFTRPPPQS